MHLRKTRATVLSFQICRPRRTMDMNLQGRVEWLHGFTRLQRAYLPRNMRTEVELHSTSLLL